MNLEIEERNALFEKQNKELCSRYQEGDESALEELILLNDAFIHQLSQFKSNRKDKFLDSEDLYQEGIIGFIKGIRTFDPEKGRFDSYVGSCIKKAVSRHFYDTENLVKQPVRFQQKRKMYKQIIQECREKHVSFPSDDELCELLHTTPYFLYYIKNFKDKLVYLDAPINEDESEAVKDTIPDHEKSFEDYYESVSKQELCVFLKSILSPSEYYIIYHCFISPEAKTQTEIGLKFNVRRQAIAQIFDRCRSILKTHFIDDRRIYQNKLIQLKRKYNFDEVRIIPIEPEEILSYMFVSGHFNDLERSIYERCFFSYKLPTEKDILEEFNMTKKEFMDTVRELSIRKDKIINTLSDVYSAFKKSMISRHKTKLLKIRVSDYHRFSPFYKILDTWKDKAYLEIIKQIGSQTVPDDDQMLLEKLFRKPVESPIHYSALERYLNLALMNKKDESESIDYQYEFIREFYNKYKSKFSQFQRQGFMSYFKSRNNRENFRQAPVNSIVKCTILEREKTDDYIRLETCSKNDIIEFLKKLRFDLSQDIIDTLMIKFKINPEDLLTDEEKNQIVVLFSNTKPLEKKMSMKKVEN